MLKDRLLKVVNVKYNDVIINQTLLLTSQNYKIYVADKGQEIFKNRDMYDKNKNLN
jgi:hypothetical protein